MGIREAIVLAGGRGTRLQSVVSDVPKPLAPVRGIPFLTYLLDVLGKQGIRRVVLSIGYMAEKIRAEYGDARGEIALAYCEEREPLGTGGALGLAEKFLESESALILNGDSYCDFSLAELSRLYEERAQAPCITAVRVEDAARFGTVQFEQGDGRITGFAEKTGISGPGWINAGVYVVRRAKLAELPSRPASLEREIFPVWMEEGLYAMPHRGAFIDIGTPESYRELEEHFQGYFGS